MSNKNQRGKVNKAVHTARLIAIANHPATTLIRLLVKLRLPITLARKIAVFVFPSIKRLL